MAGAGISQAASGAIKAAVSGISAVNYILISKPGAINILTEQLPRPGCAGSSDSAANAKPTRNIFFAKVVDFCLLRKSRLKGSRLYLLNQ